MKRRKRINNKIRLQIKRQLKVRKAKRELTLLLLKKFACNKKPKQQNKLNVKDLNVKKKKSTSVKKQKDWLNYKLKKMLLKLKNEQREKKSKSSRSKESMSPNKIEIVD